MKKEVLTRADVRFILTSGKSLTLFVKGKQKTYLSDDPLFDQLMDCVRKQDWDNLNKLMNPETLIEKLSKGAFKVNNGVVSVGTENGTRELPEELNATILEFLKDQIPFDYLINFAVKLFANPSDSSIQQLYKYLVKNRFPICEDGDFIAYRKVTDNFKDFRTGTFDNSVGSLVEMKREDVDSNPNVTCSAGLHAANWDYVHDSYYPGQGRIVVMKINPADVVSVPTDYNNAKMRVCKFLVLEEVQEEYSGPRGYKYEPSHTPDEEDPEPNMDCICEMCDGDCEMAPACEVLHCRKGCLSCFDENDKKRAELLTKVPSNVRPHTVSLFEEILSMEETVCQDDLDRLANILNKCLAFSTGTKTLFVLSNEDYSWFVGLNTEHTNNVIFNRDSFYEGLRLIRGKKSCPYDELLELRVASRERKLKVFNLKKFDKIEYRDMLGIV